MHDGLYVPVYHTTAGSLFWEGLFLKVLLQRCRVLLFTAGHRSGPEVNRLAVWHSDLYKAVGWTQDSRDLLQCADPYQRAAALGSSK
jgi:hypothetical protein